MRCCLLSLFVCIATTSSSRAIANEDVLNLDGFVAVVLRDGPSGRVVRGTVAQSQANVDASGLWPNPSLAIERQSGPILDQTNGSQDFLLVEVPLVVSGRLGLERDAAVARAGAADLDAQEHIAALRREAVEVYVEVVRAARRVLVLLEERSRLIKVVEVARRRAAAGESPPTTPLRIELELARLDDDIRLSQLARDDAHQHAQALAGQALPTFQEDFPALAAVPKATERAGVLAAGRRVDGANLDEDAAARRLIPDVTLTGGPALLSTGAQNVSVGYAVSVGIGLPIFDHGQGDAARARAARAAFEAERELLRSRSAAAVDIAIRTASAANDRASAYATAVLPAAETLWQAAERSMELGGTEGDAAAALVFVDATRALREARVTLDDLRAGAVLANANLIFVVGGWDAPQESQP